jgi:hypothetical protein
VRALFIQDDVIMSCTQFSYYTPIDTPIIHRYPDPHLSICPATLQAFLFLKSASFLFACFLNRDWTCTSQVRPLNGLKWTTSFRVATGRRKLVLPARGGTC